ncbi:BACON domain-containing protein [Parapedobacter sp. 10938]|uniref:BACON domain-containing protein n=1 Tax=Parapedobacter flavus TaxID=3110225 RepID=UPI002DBF3191|nr:BACON domain-containing protein [Parapedobacter sp. 10938]MEC3879720.1 BACON domain-containing protein [Parapedobacter sp. 10938]
MKVTDYTKLGKGLITSLSVLCLGILVFFSSCEKEDGGGTAFSLKDNPTEMIVSAQGESQTFTVQTSGAWEVEPLRDEPWMTIDPMVGTGNGTFTVTVDRNTTLEARESVLTFVVDGRRKNTVLRIDQAAREPEDGTADPYLNLDGMERLEVPEEGLYGRYTVRSTGEWKIEIPEDADWLTIEPMTGSFDQGVTVNVDLNKTPNARTADLVFYLNGEQVPDPFEVSQAGMQIILYEDFNWLNYGSSIFYTTSGETRIDKWTDAEMENGWSWNNPSADGVPSTYARDGFVKLGKTNYGSDILSPKLAAVEGTKNLQVSFKAVPYQTAGGTRDATLLKVGLIGPGTISTETFTIDNWPNYDLDPSCTEIWLAEETTRSFTITGATAETQVWFLGGDYDLRGASPNKNRIFLDDVLISVIK